MTRTERKARQHKHICKLLTKTIYVLGLLAGGIFTSIVTGEGTALVIIVFFVVPLFLTTRKIYTK